jgi:5'-deoxynucleotidase YfbR-like HD superfamily hydrolase
MSDLLDFMDKKAKNGELQQRISQLEEELIQLKLTDAELMKRLTKLEELARTRGSIGGESDATIPKA